MIPFIILQWVSPEILDKKPEFWRTRKQFSLINNRLWISWMKQSSYSIWDTTNIQGENSPNCHVANSRPRLKFVEIQIPNFEISRSATHSKSMTDPKFMTCNQSKRISDSKAKLRLKFCFYCKLSQGINHVMLAIRQLALPIFYHLNFPTSNVGIIILYLPPFFIPTTMKPINSLLTPLRFPDINNSSLRAREPMRLYLRRKSTQWRTWKTICLKRYTSICTFPTNLLLQRLLSMYLYIEFMLSGLPTGLACRILILHYAHIWQIGKFESINH